MALNFLWASFFVIAFVFALVALCTGDATVFQKVVDSTFSSSKTAFEIALGLTGVLALWLGLMKIGEEAGLVQALARLLSPVLTRLFPEIPKNHPALGSIFLNMAANMLGLDNAATPAGLKAMQHLQDLNQQKDQASNPMIMFLVLNTSGLTLIPTSILAFRAAAGAASPTDVFLPILLATTASTLAGILAVALWQRINLLQGPLLVALGGLAALAGLLFWGCIQLDRETLNTLAQAFSNLILFSVILTFIVAGLWQKLNVYEAFIAGAKEGFATAVRIIPYLVAMLVGIGVVRASGALDALIAGLSWCLQTCGLHADFSGALPTALMKPLSGSGARGLMLEAMNTYGPDSFTGRLSCIFQGATDTPCTFWPCTLAASMSGIPVMPCLAGFWLIWRAFWRPCCWPAYFLGRTCARVHGCRIRGRNPRNKSARTGDGTIQWQTGRLFLWYGTAEFVLQKQKCGTASRRTALLFPSTQLRSIL